MILTMLVAAALATVQERIDAAAPGETVVLEAGTYSGPVAVSKPLVLDGRGAVVLDGGRQGTVVRVSAAGVTLRGLVIRGSGDSFLAEDAGVRIENADHVTIEDCRLEDVLFGLYVANSSHGIFRRLWIGGKPLEMPRRGDGVRLWYSNDTLLERIEMVDSRDFIIWFAQRTVVRDCEVRRCRYGLHYMYCDDNEFENNRFVENQVGGTIMYSRRIRMNRNRFERSRGPSAYGMLFKDADDVVAEGNEFLDNTRGLFFDNSPQSEDATCEIRGNLFAWNDAGISVLSDTRRVRFEGNTFAGNLAHVELIGRGDSAKNHWSGNYWDDHPAVDFDGDGAADLPYRPTSLYEDLQARHPSLALLRFSPSMTALEAAGRMFPIARGELKLEDARPAMSPTVRPSRSRAAGAHPGMWAGSLALVLLPWGLCRAARRMLQ